MAGYVSPAALPAHVLNRPDMRDALARHDFGAVFTLARKWAGISFVKIADSCDMKPDRVGRLAKGNGSITSYEKIATIADGMRIPGHLLGLARREWEEAAELMQIAAPNSGSDFSSILPFLDGATLEEDSSGTAQEGDTVRRRQFIAAALAVGFLPQASSELIQGRRIGADTIGRLRLRTERLRRLDDVLGGADTFRLYFAELQSTTRLIREASYTEPTGKALLSLVAEQAQQAVI